MPYAGIARNSRGSPQTLLATGTTGLPPRPLSSDGWPVLSFLIPLSLHSLVHPIGLPTGRHRPPVAALALLSSGSVITPGRGGSHWLSGRELGGLGNPVLTSFIHPCLQLCLGFCFFVEKLLNR